MLGVTGSLVQILQGSLSRNVKGTKSEADGLHPSSVDVLRWADVYIGSAVCFIACSLHHRQIVLSILRLGQVGETCIQLYRKYLIYEVLTFLEDAYWAQQCTVDLVLLCPEGIPVCRDKYHANILYGMCSVDLRLVWRDSEAD
jgi:hypothetical protein